MTSDLILGLALILGIVVCTVLYLVVVNILKIIFSVRFLAKLVNDFKKVGKKYRSGEVYKRWQPWKYD